MIKKINKLANCKPDGGKNIYKIRVNCQFRNLKQENYYQLNLFKNPYKKYYLF